MYEKMDHLKQFKTQLDNECREIQAQKMQIEIKMQERQNTSGVSHQYDLEKLKQSYKVKQEKLSSYKKIEEIIQEKDN